MVNLDVEKVFFFLGIGHLFKHKHTLLCGVYVYIVLSLMKKSEKCI